MKEHASRPSSLLVFLSILAMTACGHGAGDGPGSSGASGANGANGANGSSGSAGSSGASPHGATGTGVVKLTLRAK